MTFEYNDVVILQRHPNISTENFVGRIFGYDEWDNSRLKLIPLSEVHDLYCSYPKDYIVKNCGFNIEPFVHKVKTGLIQTLLEGCVYEI